MLHLIIENTGGGNREMENNIYYIPKELKKYLADILANYQGKRDCQGYKHLNNILQMDGINYREMKGMKHFFDTYNGLPNAAPYVLNGGTRMKDWVNLQLSNDEKKIKDYKQHQKELGRKNAFNKPKTPKGGTRHESTTTSMEKMLGIKSSFKI